jgi:hypothetical protein
MSEIQRICAQCGKSSALETRYCSHCGYDAQAGLPAPRNTLPATIGKAALPVLAGVASLALRAGWKFLQSRLAEATVRTSPQNAVNPVIPTPKTTTPIPQNPQPALRRTRRTIHIRSSWAVGDANGTWQQGNSEHTIEIDD